MSLSYRVRGYDDRTQTNQYIIISSTNNRDTVEMLINSVTVKYEMKIILEYSAINNKANLTPPYSTLKPDTSSDSLTILTITRYYPMYY
jgi:hypothetical protein